MIRAHGRRRVWTGAVAVACVIAAARLAAIDMEPRTANAYDEYLERARQAFLSRVSKDAVNPPADGTIIGGPGQQDGIIEVPGGLVHHWLGRTFLQGVTLRDALAVSQAYTEYSTIHEPIIASRVLAHEGDTYRVLMRLKEGDAGITAVFDIRSTVRYVRPGAGTVYAISISDEIREVANAGEPDERLMSPGRDSGYLWRASTFSRFVQLDGGVYVEMETLGLSRRFPRMLGWIIEPIARRLGRKSVEASLKEFTDAVRSRAR